MQLHLKVFIKIDFHFETMKLKPHPSKHSEVLTR